MTEAASNNPGQELSPGATVGRYVVLRTLGRGGMGVVYEAHDPELDRRVALKVLSTVLGDSNVSQARLRREAQALAKLSHPNVVSVHDVGSFGDRIFLAMERIEGQTLSAWLDERPRSWREVLAVFRQAGEGLAAAHAEGLIHRDFKPENVLVDRRGRARVLDFGLARAADSLDEDAARRKPPSDPEALAAAARAWDQERAARADAATLASDGAPAPSAAPPPKERADAMARTVEAPTVLTRGGPASGTLLASPLTATGALMGTPLYMSPEQHLRNPIDARTDQFSFAVALHEALYQKHPFDGASLFDLRRAVLTGKVPEPPMGSPVPDRIRRALLRALQTAPAARFADMEALLAELTEEDARPSRRVFLAATAAVVGAGAIAAMLGARAFRPRPAAAPVRYQRLTFNGATQLVLSPDGRRIAHQSGDGKIVVRDLASGAERAVFEGAHYFLHWRSSTELGLQEMSARMLAVPIDGGPTREVPFEALRSPDGGRALRFRASWKHVVIEDLATREETTLPVTGQITFIMDVAWSPNGGLLAVSTMHEGAATLHAVPLDGGEQHVLVREGSVEAAAFSPRGDALYYLRQSSRGAAGSDLMKLRIDPGTGAARGAPETVLSGVDASGAVAISPDGQNLYLSRGSSIAHFWTVDLPPSPGEQKARVERLTTSARQRGAFAVSPDGRVAIVVEIDAGVKLMAIPLDGSPPREVPCGGDIAMIHDIAWSPDGKDLAMIGSDRGDGRSFLYRLPAAGGEPRKSDFVVGEMLAWAPHRDILADAVGNMNYHRVDPATFQTRDLLREIDGWVMVARIAPDGATAAVWWNRKSDAGDGIWIVSLVDGSSRLLLKTTSMPVGFSHDGTSVYTAEPVGDETHLQSTSIVGAMPTPLGRIPFQNGTFSLAVIPGTDRFVALVREGGPDLWVAEGFDPEAVVR